MHTNISPVGFAAAPGLTAAGHYISALEAACHIAVERRRMKLPRVRIPLDLATEQLDNPAVIETTLVMLAEHALPPTCLALRLPELLFPLAPPRKQTLDRLRTLGMVVSLGGFAVDPL